MIKTIKTSVVNCCPRRLLGAILCILMLLPLLTACAGAETDSSDTSADKTIPDSIQETTGAVTDYYRNIPEGLRYDGYTFKILSYDAETWDVYLDADSVTGALLNDAAYARNLEVQNLLGIEISVTKIPHAEIVKQIQTGNAAGDGVYDLVCFWATTNMATLLTENQVYDWKKLNSVDLTSPWYNQTANEAFYIAGKQYLAVSDLTYSVQQHFRFLCNLDLLSSNGLAAPYGLVYDGKWTYDKLYEYTSNYYNDSNGNGTADKDDTYGLVTSANGVSRFINNWGENPVSIGSDGFVINIFSDKLVSSLSKMNALLWAGGTFFGTTSNEHYDIFNNGRSLFEIYTSDPALLLGIEGFKFGYLPYPKYDESQDNYITVTHGGIMAVPLAVSNPDRAGTVIEALSAASSKFMEKAFIDNYIEGRVLQDEDSVNMYRLMRATAFYDVSRYVDPSGYFSGLSYYTELLKNNDNNLSSRNAGLSRAIIRGYDEIFQALVKND